MIEIICADATEYIKNSEKFDSVITSLPDKEETTMDFATWRRWFVQCVKGIMEKTENYAIFYQTDRKKGGATESKSFLLNYAAEQAKSRLLWHKIVLRREPGKIDLFRPTYTHMMCFSKNKKSGKATPDVINRGEMTYDNAMGTNACKTACEHIRRNSNTKTITDPFCGQGSTLAAAVAYGFDVVGVDILPDQCRKAEKLINTKVQP